MISIEFDVKATNENKHQVIASMAAITELLNAFQECKDTEEIGAHIARINGYVYALVNMEVITEEDANGKLADAVLLAAENRNMEIVLGLNKEASTSGRSGRR